MQDCSLELTSAAPMEAIAMTAPTMLADRIERMRLTCECRCNRFATATTHGQSISLPDVRSTVSAGRDRPRPPHIDIKGVET